MSILFFWHMYFYCRWSFELKTFNWLLKGMFFRKKEGKNSIIFHSYNCHTIPLLTPICQYMIYHSSFVKFFFWEIVIKGYKVVFGHNKSLWQMVKFSITLHSSENLQHYTCFSTPFDFAWSELFLQNAYHNTLTNVSLATRENTSLFAQCELYFFVIILEDRTAFFLCQNVKLFIQDFLTSKLEF